MGGGVCDRVSRSFGLKKLIFQESTITGEFCYENGRDPSRIFELF